MLTLYKGDSTPERLVKIENIDISICTAEQVLRDKFGVAVITEAAVTATKLDQGVNHFNCYFTSAQTNLITDYRKEYVWSCRVVSVTSNPTASKEIIIDTIVFLPPNIT